MKKTFYNKTISYKNFIKKLKNIKKKEGVLTDLYFLDCSIFDIPQNVEVFKIVKSKKTIPFLKFFKRKITVQKEYFLGFEMKYSFFKSCIFLYKIPHDKRKTKRT